MNCKEYRTLHAKHTDLPLRIEVWGSDEAEEWRDHADDCTECSEWSMAQYVQKNGDNHQDYPCVHIAYYSQHNCEEHKDPLDCPDTTLVKQKNGFGIPVRDGGFSVISISNCPWCGISLNNVK